MEKYRLTNDTKVRDFTNTPGARYKTDGDFSGEWFLFDILLPKFEVALKEKKKLLVDLDGTQGYATSFLEEAFGGLSRKYGVRDVINTLQFKSDDEPELCEEIVEYIKNAKNM